MAGAHAGPLLRGAREGRLLLQRCTSCGHVPSFPRIACPRCFAELDWFAASGRGTVRTYGVVRRSHERRFAEHLPIVLALIALEEGVEVISTIVGDGRLAVEIGAPVELAVAERWSPLPQFRSLETAGAPAQ